MNLILKTFLATALVAPVLASSGGFLEGDAMKRELQRNAHLSTAPIPAVEGAELFSITNDTREIQKLYITVNMEDSYGICNKSFSENMQPGAILSKVRKDLGDEFNSAQAAGDGVRITGLKMQLLGGQKTVTILEDGTVGGIFTLSAMLAA